MISPVDQYRMSTRSVKYQFLFLALAATMFLTRKVDWYSLQNVDVAASLMNNNKTSVPKNGPPDLPSRQVDNPPSV